MEPPRRGPQQRRGTHLELLLGGDTSGSDASDSLEEDKEDSRPTETDAVVSRVHAGLTSIAELHRTGPRVVQMNLFGNRIATLDGLQRFVHLQELCLSNNQLEELSFHELDPLKQLRVLDLSANRLTTLRGLPLLPRLEEMSLAHNRLTGLEGMLRPVKLPKLRYLDVRGNQLASPVALVALQHLTRLVHLRLQSRDGAVSNPICELEEYPDALLEFLPTLKELDEEDVRLLRELSRLRMPKYHSVARRKQNTQPRDGSSQTTPAKQGKGSAGDLRVFTESRERVGYQVTNNGQRRAVGSTTPTTPRPRSDTSGHAVPTTPARSPRAQNASETPAPALPARVVLREVCTNTDLDYEKAILEREAIILEKQSTILAREQDFLRKETESLAKEKENQEEFRHLQGQLTASLERIAKLETLGAQERQEWEAKLHKLEQLHATELQAQEVNQKQLAVILEEAERLRAANAALSADLKAKETVVDRLQQAANLTQQQEEAATKGIDTRVAALEAALKDAEERCRQSELQLKSQQSLHEATVGKLTQQMTRLDDECRASTKASELMEKRLEEMRASRDQYREECLHKDDELYRLKKALMQKSEEVEDARVQVMKATERQDRMQQQQQQLYEKQLQASVAQLEMEFRREHQQATEKLQLVYRKYQDSVRQQQRMKGSYESSLKREALLKEEVHRLAAIIEGDKQKLVDQELTKRAEYEFRIQRLEDEKKALQDELQLVKHERTKVSNVEQLLNESRLESDRLLGERKKLEEVIQVWEAKEGDWKAVLKVKDTMLNDQMRQLEELRAQNKKLEEDYQQDTGEFQGQIEDLEEALDECLQKESKWQERYERVKSALAEKEETFVTQTEKIADMTKELELKNAALELIEGEMDRMRDTLSKQDDLFQRRLERHLEQHREELERARAAKEEAEGSVQAKFEEQLVEMEKKYDMLAEDLKDMAAQNTKLRVALDQERKKNLQSDREMRVLLAQLDRERHVKNERLGDIKRLFEQLQQETP